jgi:hypothetical protein
LQSGRGSGSDTNKDLWILEVKKIMPPPRAEEDRRREGEALLTLLERGLGVILGAMLRSSNDPSPINDFGSICTHVLE